MTDWQPISTAPMDWQPILVWAITEQACDEAEDDGCEPERCAVVAVHSDIQPGLWWMHSHLARVFEPTHWMPLPPAPSGDLK